MAIKHKAELGLDPASTEIIVLRRLIDGDYFVEEGGELKLTARRALDLFQPGYWIDGVRHHSSDGVHYWLRLHPESGCITASRKYSEEFAGPVIARLVLIGLISEVRVRMYPKAICNDCDFCEDEPAWCDCDKSLSLDEDQGRIIVSDVYGDETLLELVQEAVDSISCYLKTKKRPEGMFSYDELGDDDPRWCL